jgi:5'-3' exonuclease
MTMNTKKKLTIIDADGLLFYAAWAHRGNMSKFGIMAVKEKVDQIILNLLKKTKADCYLGFYGVKSSNTFRHSFATIRPYKGTRRSEEWQEYFKPIIKDYYGSKWNFYGVNNLEADDAVIIAYHQFKDEYDVTMVGEDKDMHQIGEFKWYNPKDNTARNLSYEEGRKFYWCQHIEGDSADNIGGIPGEGKKSKLKEQILEMEEFSDEKAFNLIRNFYIDKHGEDYLYHLLENHILLTMMSQPSFDYPTNIDLISVKKETTISKLKSLNL